MKEPDSEEKEKTMEEEKTKTKEALFYYNSMNEFKETINKPKEMNVYAINRSWLKQWKAYVNYPKIKINNMHRIENEKAPSPKPSKDLTNNDLLQKDNKYIDKKHHNNIRYVPRKVWELFNKNYSLEPEIKILKRKHQLLRDGLFTLQQPFCFHMRESIPRSDSYLIDRNTLDNSTQYSFIISYDTTALELIKFIKKNRELSSLIGNSELSLWKLTLDKTLDIHHTPEANSKGSHYKRHCLSLHTVLKDVIDIKDSIILCEYSSFENCIMNHSLREASRNGQQGRVGLNNLGNTCYMNSALQCVSNCDLLTEYFLKYYTPSIINPVSSATQGKLTNAYYDLIKNCWNTNGINQYSPSSFKREIGNYEDTFRNYNQQDSHELLSYFLNGLQDDLNLITNFQSIPTPQGIQSNDSLCRNRWVRYLARNQSIITDLFFGMYKSEIQCLEKQCIVKVFEMFLSFQLPLNVNYITLTFVCYDIAVGNIQLKIPIETDKTFGHLRKIVSEIFGVKEDGFYFGKVGHDSNGGMIIEELYNCFGIIGEMRNVSCFEINPLIVNRDNEHEISLASDILNKSKDAIENIMKKMYEPVIYFKDNYPSMNDDNNNNLHDRYVKVVMNIIHEGKRKYQRVIVFDKEITIENLYKEIKTYLGPLLKSPYATTPSDFQFELLYDSPIIKDINLNVINPNIKRLVDVIRNSNHNKEDNNINDHLFIPITQRGTSDGKSHRFTLNIVLSSSYNSFTDTVKTINLPNDPERAYHLEYCIKQFSDMRTMKGEWRCPHCQKMVYAKKSMFVYTTSQYLIIQLKRFKEDLSSKFNHLINFPINGFDMSDYVPGNKMNSLYDLIGVINHYGSFDGGHYTAYARNSLDNQWREFNDSHVSIISESRIVTSAAYVLFYKRRYIDKQIDKETLLNKTKPIPAEKCFQALINE